MSNPPGNFRRKLRSLYVWHRYVGISVAMLVLLLAITGILLNHTETFELDSRHIESDWLMDWYGIPAPEGLVAYISHDNTIAHIGDKIYWNRKRLPGHYSAVHGLLEFTHFSALAVSGEIILLTHKGEIIERLTDMHGVPAGMKRIGLTDDETVIIEAAHGFYRTNRDFLNWSETTQVDKVVWSRPIALAQQQRQQIISLARSSELSTERVLLDLHSGRLFGHWGPWLMDTAAVMLMFLSISGFTIWLRQIIRRRRRFQNKHPH